MSAKKNKAPTIELPPWCENAIQQTKRYRDTAKLRAAVTYHLTQESIPSGGSSENDGLSFLIKRGLYTLEDFISNGTPEPELKLGPWKQDHEKAITQIALEQEYQDFLLDRYARRIANGWRKLCEHNRAQHESRQKHAG